MNVLVTYGSSNGGTAELAAWVGEALRQRAVDVTVADAALDPDPSGFDAVVIGGAPYATRWNKDARRYIKRHASILRTKPAFFFSSGPLDESATDTDIPPVGGVQTLMARVGATEHATFGGRLEPDAKGFMARKIAEKSAGDYRDRDHVERWVDTVVRQLDRSSADTR